MPLAGFQHTGSTPLALQLDGNGSQYVPSATIYVVATGGGRCGLGAKLALLLPALGWLRRRCASRLRGAD